MGDTSVYRVRKEDKYYTFKGNEFILQQLLLFNCREVCSSLCSPTLMMDLDEDAPPSPAQLPDDTQVPDPTLPEHEASVELLTNVSPSILQLLHQDSEDENPPS